MFHCCFVSHPWNMWCVCLCVGAVSNRGRHDRVGKAWERAGGEGAAGQADPTGAGGSGTGHRAQQIRTLLRAWFSSARPGPELTKAEWGLWRTRFGSTCCPHRDSSPGLNPPFHPSSPLLLHPRTGPTVAGLLVSGGPRLCACWKAQVAKGNAVSIDLFLLSLGPHQGVIFLNKRHQQSPHPAQLSFTGTRWFSSNWLFLPAENINKAASWSKGAFLQEDWVRFHFCSWGPVTFFKYCSTVTNCKLWLLVYRLFPCMCRFILK